MLDPAPNKASPSDATPLPSPSAAPWHPFAHLPVSKRTPLTIERALGFWFERGISRPQKADRPYFGEAIPELLRQIDLLNQKYRAVPKKKISESQELQDELTRLFNQLAPRIWPDFPLREQALWLVDAAAETNDPLYPRDLYASKPEDAQILHTLFCDLIIAKLMKKSENNARDERERKRRSTALDETPDQSADLETTGLRSGGGYTVLDASKDAPAVQPLSPIAAIKEVKDVDPWESLDEDGEISDGSDDSVIPFRAHNWNAVNTAVMDSVASRTRPLKKKTSKAMSTAGLKRPAETQPSKRATKVARTEPAVASDSRLIVKLKLNYAGKGMMQLLFPTKRPPRLASYSPQPGPSTASPRLDQVAVEHPFKRPSIPLPSPSSVQHNGGRSEALYDYVNHELPHHAIKNGALTQQQTLSLSNRPFEASLDARVSSEPTTNSEVRRPSDLSTDEASGLAGLRPGPPAPVTLARPREQTDSSNLSQTSASIDNTQQAHSILKRTRCYFDMADAIGRSGVVCFPLSRLVDAASLFSVVESYVPEAFQRENTPRAITISLFRPSVGPNSCELPFEPCFIKQDPWSRYTFDAFFLALEQRLNAAAETIAPPHLLLTAVWERINQI